MKDLVGFSVIVQTYWRLKVDGSHIIFRGDIASPDGRLYHLSLAKNSKYDYVRSSQFFKDLSKVHARDKEKLIIHNQKLTVC